MHIRVQCRTYPRTTLNTTEKCCAKQVWWKPPKSCFSKQENKMGVECIMWAMSSENRPVIKLLQEYNLYAENVGCIFYCSKTSFWWWVEMFSESGLESTMWGRVEVRGQCILVTVNQFQCVNFSLKGIVHP